MSTDNEPDVQATELIGATADEAALLRELAEGGLVRFQAKVEAGFIPMELAQRVLEKHLRRRHRGLFGRLLHPAKAAS